MADSIELRASVNSIKRVDPYVRNILTTATQVALYKFNIAQGEWEKTDKEGALFLYTRNGEPYHSIIILNRLNKDNFIEPIIKDFDYQMQLPFLLYRNCKSKIFGIWFFNKDECIRVASLIESLMDKDQGDDRPQRHDRRQNGQGNMDIFSMLSKAQENFGKTPTKQESIPSAFSSTPRVPDIASQSVMDFFAKASTKTTQKAPVTGENVLHRLMSNPAHSVEHIEKQQRSITPQEQVSFRMEAATGTDRRSVPINFASKSGAQRKFDNFEVNGFKIASVSPPKQTVSSSPLAYLMQNQPPSGHQVEEHLEDLETSPFQQFLEIAHKPLLMTPMMFTAPNPTKEITSGSSIVNSPGDGLEPVEMLTEKQLAQALIYLLKNNSDFIKQIHQAYTNSILEKVENPKDRGNL